MWFALIIAIIVIAGWIFLASSDKVTRGGDTGPDESLPVNAYDNPYDTKENNDRPFEPDTCVGASDTSSSDDSCSSDSGSND